MPKIIEKSLLVITASITLGFPFLALGLGQSVQPIIIENAQRGENYETTVSVFNTENKSIDVYLKTSGQIEGWASFFDIDDTEKKEPIESLSVGPQSYGYASVIFKIPDFIANGEYKGSVVAGTKPSETSNKNTAQIGFEVPREVTIKVGGEQTLVYEADVLAGNIFLNRGEAFNFTVVYHNKGNVNIKPIVKFKALNTGNEIANVIFPYPDDSVAIAPMSSRRMNYNWTPPASEKKGALYEVLITPAVGDKEMDTETFTLNVGDNPQTNIILANISSVIKKGGILYIVVGGGILALLILAIVVKKIKNKKNQVIESSNT